MKTKLLAALAVLAPPATVLSIALAVTAPALAQPAAPDAAMADVLAHDRRAEDRARDPHRNPAETLAFFGVRPGMTVMDYMPSGGWYTRILVPYLGPEGTYIALNPAVPADATGFMGAMRDTAQNFPAQAAGWTGPGGARVLGGNVGSVPEDLHGTVDRFLIFREVHNMHRFDWLRASLADARALLKDDGLVGVVQHRGKADAPASYTDGHMGYLREADVIALFQANGFDLAGRSEVNANPRDPADHPRGVWMLPPGLSGASDESRPALEAIGESDRMTLLFRKRP